MFGSELRRMRLDAGLSQDDLGRRAGYNGPSISRLESGDRMLSSLAKLKDIATVLGVKRGNKLIRAIVEDIELEDVVPIALDLDAMMTDPEVSDVRKRAIARSVRVMLGVR